MFVNIIYYYRADSTKLTHLMGARTFEFTRDHGGMRNWNSEILKKTYASG